ILVVVFSNLVFITGYIPVDTTPIGLFFATISFLWVTFRQQMFGVVPIARENIMEDVEESIVVLNRQGKVMDINQSAKERFGVDSNIIGKPGEELFADYPEYVDKYEKVVETTNDEITLESDGETKHLQLSISPVRGSNSEVIGRSFVFNDITELKKREEELQRREEEQKLMKDTMSRFLRHNIRNQLNVANSYAEMVADETNGHEEELRKIAEVTQEVLDESEKARQIEKVVDNTGEVRNIDLSKVIDKAVTKLREEHLEADMEVSMPDDEVWIKSSGHIETAIENLVENAIVHNDSETPEVTVSVETTDEDVRVHIQDNGSGIPEHEIEVFRQRTETDLLHSNGFGLWLVNWIVGKSDGELKFDADESGTRVTVVLKRGEPDKTQNSHNR
ncbi:MAG: ATP-binding protein, partial [Halobacteria archaeon]|nr:ATP-binding protein [Halobacteria archaeon]